MWEVRLVCSAQRGGEFGIGSWGYRTETPKGALLREAFRDPSIADAPTPFGGLSSQVGPWLWRGTVIGVGVVGG